MNLCNRDLTQLGLPVQMIVWHMYIAFQMIVLVLHKQVGLPEQESASKAC